MGATTIMVTEAIAFIGMKVVRGRDWTYGDQDKGSEYARIIAIGPPVTAKGWVRVKWENGAENSYRVYEAYDLYLYKDDPAKLLHWRDVNVGDWVEAVDLSKYYMDHAKIILGEKYQVKDKGTSLDTHYTHPNGQFLLKDKNGQLVNGGYWVGIDGFKKCDPPTIIPKHVDLTKPYTWKDAPKRGSKVVRVSSAIGRLKVGGVYVVQDVNQGSILVVGEETYWSSYGFAPFEEPSSVVKYEMDKEYNWFTTKPGIGDKLIRVTSDYGNTKQGGIYTVRSVRENGIEFVEVGLSYYLPNFAPYESSLESLREEVNNFRFKEPYQNSESLKTNKNGSDNTGYKVRRPISTIEGPKRRSSSPVRCRGGSPRLRCDNSRN